VIVIRLVLLVVLLVIALPIAILIWVPFLTRMVTITAVAAVMSVFGRMDMTGPRLALDAAVRFPANVGKQTFAAVFESQPWAGPPPSLDGVGSGRFLRELFFAIVFWASMLALVAMVLGWPSAVADRLRSTPQSSPNTPQALPESTISQVPRSHEVDTIYTLTFGDSVAVDVPTTPQSGSDTAVLRVLPKELALSTIHKRPTLSLTICQQSSPAARIAQFYAWYTDSRHTMSLRWSYTGPAEPIALSPGECRPLTLITDDEVERDARLRFRRHLGTLYVSFSRAVAQDSFSLPTLANLRQLARATRTIVQ
jgi:hypothetical protein